MFFKNILGFFSEIIVQHVADTHIFRKTALFLNRHFSPKNDVLVNVKGHKMYANTLDRIAALYLWKFSSLEDIETKIMEKIVKNGMVVFDIGANIGYYSLIFANMVGPNGKVYVFEPDPSNYRLLVKNIKANDYTNVVAVQKAVSDKPGTISFYLSEEHRGDHRIYDPGDGREVINVEATTLDKFANKKIAPDIIKMDIEGAELLAFLGAEKLIKRKKNIIIISEFWPYAIRKLGHSPKQFIDSLKKYGFKLKVINEKKGVIEQISYASLMKICKGRKYTNLFLER